MDATQRDHYEETIARLQEEVRTLQRSEASLLVKLAEKQNAIDAQNVAHRELERAYFQAHRRAAPAIRVNTALMRTH